MLDVKEIRKVVEKDGTKEKKVASDNLYGLVDSFVKAFEPSHKNQFDTRWISFYIPAYYKKIEAALPFSVMRYKNDYWVSFQRIGAFVVSHGDKNVNGTYFDIFRSAMLFDKISDKEALDKLVPHALRTGKVERRYVEKCVEPDVKMMSKEESDAIIAEYEKHEAELKPSKPISLNDYLRVAAIAYAVSRDPNSGFKNEDESKFSPIELYKRHNGRHSDMLDIKNPDSARQFSRWLNGSTWEGSHPFEIVFGPNRFGIQLWPPLGHGINSFRFDRTYVLSAGDFAYASMYVRMTRALIKKNVSFKAPGLKEALEFLRGDMEFTVNCHSNEHVDYTGAGWEKKLFPHIKWDELEVLKRS